MKEIDVEKIMEEIRAEIKAKGYKASDLSFADIPLHEKKSDLESDISVLNNGWRLNYYRNGGCGLKGLVVKIVRKLMKPVVYDLFNQESNYNAACTRTINSLNERIKHLEEKIAKMENK